MRLGRVEVTPGFLILAAWLNYVDDQGLLLPALACCALHELGHLFILSKLKKSVKYIRITAIGAEMCVEESLSYAEELAAALAGPCVNLSLAAMLCRLPGGAMLAGMNLVLACFNLMPVRQLDGGRALRCLLALLLEPERGERLAALSSWLAALSVCAASLWLAGSGGNVTLAMVAVWLLTAAIKEGKMEEIGLAKGAGKR